MTATGDSHASCSLPALERALDALAEGGEPFLGQFEVLGGAERCLGGQGVVQFVRGVASRQEFAVKVHPMYLCARPPCCTA